MKNHKKGNEFCDKVYISSKLAIELDDKTHERPDRIERDSEVERILADAGMPLLRIQNHGAFNVAELSAKIKTSREKYQRHYLFATESYD